MISDKFKCIFIHIPKNAGTSIESKICSEEGTENLMPDHRTILDFEPISLDKILMMYKKDQLYSAARRAKYFVRQHKLGSFYRPASGLKYRKYIKFTVVRNPWSRVNSWYRNIRRDINHLNTYRISSDCSFHDFIKYHFDSQPALRSQFYWICDSKGNIPMDFIARFENLESDFLKIAQAIGFKDSELPKKRYTGESASYMNAYNSVTKDIIWTRYKKEIDHFGFEFGE